MAHGRDLRRGRFSEAGGMYLLTMVCTERETRFGNFAAAHVVVKVMHHPAIAVLAETLAFVVMPDHVHWLICLRDEVTLGEVVRRFKARVTIGLGSSPWQRGFYDHALRSDEDIPAAARYVVANPVRAGLVDRVGDYPHWDAVWL